MVGPGLTWNNDTARKEQGTHIHRQGSTAVLGVKKKRVGGRLTGEQELVSPVRLSTSIQRQQGP